MKKQKNKCRCIWRDLVLIGFKPKEIGGHHFTCPLYKPEEVSALDLKKYGYK